MMGSFKQENGNFRIIDQHYKSMIFCLVFNQIRKVGPKTFTLH